MKRTLAELADLVDGTVSGDESVTVSGLAGIPDAQEGDITFLSNPKYRQQILTTKASAVIAANNVEGASVPFIITDEPYVAYAKIAQLFFQKPVSPCGISDQASVSPNARVGQDPSIFPFVYVGGNAIIGDRVICYPGVYIGDNVTIGDDVVLHPHVTGL